MKRWYVLECHRMAESKAEKHLKNQGFQAYFPQYRKRRSHARKVDWMTVPLFPGYLFVCLDTAVYGWRAVRSTVGVRTLLSVGEKPLAVPEGIVEDIQAREEGNGLIALEAPPPFVPGEAVEVVNGPMRAQSGWFEKMTDQDRVQVLLSLLGRQVRMVLPTQDVRCAS